MRWTAPMYFLLVLITAATTMAAAAGSGDGNPVFSPCEDATVRKGDGFTLGFALSTRDSFFSDGVQLSPCDPRLGLPSNPVAQVAAFRPYIDEISLLTINATTLPSIFSGAYMVAFAGRKYAARSFPTFVGNSSYIVTSFTLVLEFQKGTLQNLFWKADGCSSCSGVGEKTPFVCVNDGQACAVKAYDCKIRGGPMDCSLGVQLAFSGMDTDQAVLNSWYEVSKLRQYSLYALFLDVKDSITSPFKGFFF